MNKTKLLLIFISVLFVFVYPVLFIFSLNLLFPVLAIPINIYTYIASFIISSKLNPIQISFNA